MKNAPSNEIGYTLIELVITVTIIAVIAAIAVPAFSSDPDEQLQLAAQEFAAAMRFARSESMRTGDPHGFRQESNGKRIRVFRLDEATNPPGLVYDVYHPVEKQLYEYDLNVQSLAGTPTLDHDRTYRGTCNSSANVYFDDKGTPWCANPSNILLERFDVHFEKETDRITLTLDGITGRVTVQ
jgi:type II secretion system protein H